jgi:hypothetical protein
MTDLAWSSVGRCLGNGSPAMAAAELVSLALVSDAQSKACIQHLRSCVFSWVVPPGAVAAINQIDAAFLGLVKPEPFTNYNHCYECKAHDDTLRHKTVKTIGRRDLGNLGYSPLSFMTAEGFAYYFPAFARLMVLPDLSEDQDLFLDLVAARLSGNRDSSQFLPYCNERQRTAVVMLLEWFVDSDIALSCYQNDWKSWAEGVVVWRKPQAL